MDRAVMNEANLKNAVLERAVFTRSDLTGAVVEGADFSNALLDKLQQMVRLGWWNSPPQIMPSKINALERLKKFCSGWTRTGSSWHWQ